MPAVTCQKAARAFWRRRPTAIHTSGRELRRALIHEHRVGALRQQTRGAHDHSPKWRPISVLDEWVAKEARPISLRQIMVFGRSLTESRLISSANYIRTELPTRLAHRIRDMQLLPYVVVTNPHISEVYDLYYTAFDAFRKVKEIRNLEDNDRFCKVIQDNLRAHLAVIPKLAMGVLECNGLMEAEELDKFMNTILRARISRRVIAEQHLSLTETFHAPEFSPGTPPSDSEFIGNVFLKCVAKDVIERCGQAVQALLRSAYGPDVQIPRIQVEGHLHASFPFILSHLEYIIGELLRNSVQSVVERYNHQQQGSGRNSNGAGPSKDGSSRPSAPPDIQVTICDSPQHVTIRISDRGGGIPRDVLPHLWSFSKGPQSERLLANLRQVPKMAATLQELRADAEHHYNNNNGNKQQQANTRGRKANSAEASAVQSSGLDTQLPQPQLAHSPDYWGSLASLSGRPPNLRLGMGLPLSRVYAEYWAGSLTLHSLAGYGVDVFLGISKLGNKNEQLTTRALVDAV